MRLLRLFLPAFALLLPVAATRADELLPTKTAIPEAIDHYIDRQLADQGIKPADLADDAAFLRRVTLDLVGRIPTVVEYREYLASDKPGKKAELIERLLASPAYVRHQATEFDIMLASQGGGKRNTGDLRGYLLNAFKDERSWDNIFRDLVQADEKEPGQKGASQFLKSRVTDLDRLTTDVSVLFFGVNISCAQCHDHPLVHDWKQDHYYGMKSFFARTYLAGQFLGEKETGGIVQFKTTKNETKTAKTMFLTGKVVETPESKLTPEQLKKLAEEEKKKPKADPNKQPTPPSFSARKALADLALQPEQRHFFSKSIVNRLWTRLLGYGLVSPIDQMHSENPASHPELLEWLARDISENGYNLKRLIRGIVSSKTYARSTRYAGEKFPAIKTFAMGRLRALTPAQLGTSMRIATTDPKQFEGLKPADLDKKIEALEASGRGIASKIEYPGEDFQISVTEALLFSNNEAMQKDLLTEGTDKLLGKLKEAKSPEEVVETAATAILTRPLTAEERKVMSDYVAARKDKAADAHKQLVWALLASAEFRFNH